MSTRVPQVDLARDGILVFHARIRWTLLADNTGFRLDPVDEDISPIDVAYTHIEHCL